MTPTDPAPAAPRMATGLRVLLGVSLALNLLILGLALGALMRFGGLDGMRAPPHALGAALYRELPGEARRALRADMARGPDRGTRHPRDEMSRIAGMLRRDPFDPAALASALDDHDRMRSRWLASVQSAWLDQVRAMSAAERAAYADRLERALERRHHRRGPGRRDR